MSRSTDAGLLELIGEVQGLLELEELQQGLLVALDRLMPSDWVSINVMGPAPDQIDAVAHPPLEDRHLIAFARHAYENPIAARFARTRDSRAYRFSDIVTQDELHALGLYRELYAELGIEFQIAFVVKTSSQHYVAIALSRRSADFTDEERALLDRARPFLIQIYRNAFAHAELQALRSAHATGTALVGPLIARGLTARAADVLSRVAHGQSNADVAATLGISERTVGKHLQNCYQQLGVANRSQAAALAWAGADPPERNGNA
jgi:DNA-binding CsgD family transcriptional regulator